MDIKELIRITEPSRLTPVTHSCRTLVCGGGIAGIAAAIAAAREGADVILLEREYGLGGMATLGLITIYLPLCDGEGRQISFGLAEELLRLSIKHGAEDSYPAAWLDGGTHEEKVKNRFLTRFNPHFFALAAEELLLSLGVRILYGTVACGVSKSSGGAISHVLIENKSGRSAIEVENVIDCTGDADVCTLAEAPTALYAAGNGLASWYYYLEENNPELKLKMFGLADLIPDREYDRTTHYDAGKVQTIAGARFSGVDGAELSEAVIAAHKSMFADILQSGVVPVRTSSIPLVRMSRRLSGAVTQDIDTDRKFLADSVGMTPDWRKRGPAFEISYRTLYTEKVPNLLAAGRCISVSDELWDVTRVIPPCAVTGEAAGTAAAMTNSFAALDITKLQTKLQSNGVKLHNG
ncbi:MAG: FAD-dependent oxidoreductase [Oscillospiraceae bacterium]|jgi:hypothetical protein|nr:FAD-dependent oxidoreductase [Oscillospiraceae bacterium]